MQDDPDQAACADQPADGISRAADSLHNRKSHPVSAMFRITLPDGSVREVAPGTTPADIAAAIGPGLAKAAIAARVDGDLLDIGRPCVGDAQLALASPRY